MNRLVRSLARRPVGWLLGALVATGVSAWFGAGLDLRADLLSMLPEDVPAARAYRDFLEDFGGLERIFVVVSASEGNEVPAEDLDQRIVEAALRLEERLSGLDLVADVRAGLEPADERFFLEYLVPRTLLRSEAWTADRVALRLQPEELRRRAVLLRDKLRNPVGELETTLARWDPLGLASEELAGRTTELGLSVDPLTGIFRGRGGAALLMVEPAVSELDAAAGRQLAESLWAEFGEVEEQLGPGIRVGAVGGPLYAAEDERVVRADLQRTISVSALGCLLVLVSAFGGWRAAAMATAVLVSAFSLSFALIRLLQGELLAVSLGFAAVLVGLGIDYVIHVVTRYRQALEDLGAPEAALAEVAAESGRALVASASTTAMAFAVMTLSELRPLREVGLLVSVGIASMLLCTLFVGAPLMALLFRDAESARSGGALAWLWRPAGAVPAALVRWSTRRPRLVTVGALTVFLLALMAARDLRFEPHLGDFRPDDYGLEETERFLAEQFGIDADTATVLVTGADLDQALERSRAVTAALRRDEDGPPRTSRHEVSSPAELLLSESSTRQRLEELQDLDLGAAVDRLEESMLEVGLRPAGFAPGLEALREIGRGRVPTSGGDLPWPDWISSQIAGLAEDGPVTVALRVRTDETGSRRLAEDDAVARLRRAAGLSADADEVRIASAVALGEQMRRVGESEAGVLAAASFGVVLVVVLVAVRFSPLAALLALLPVLVGASVAFGVLGATSGRLDFLSLAVVPMLCGIGIDDGLHALCGQPGRARGRRWLGSVAGTPQRVVGAGRAITLTTLTTVVGFGSLVTSAMPGLRTGGVVVAVGVVACWWTTVLLLPALTARIAADGGTGDGDLAGGEGDQAFASSGGGSGRADGLAPASSDHWKRRLGRMHFSGPLWYRLHAWTLRHLPSWMISAFMVPVVAGFFLGLGQVRRALVSNRRRALGPSRWGLPGEWLRAYRALFQHAWCFSETYEGLFDPSSRRLTRVAGEANWHRVTAPGGDGEPVGFVIVTAHVGHWEVGSHLSRFEHPRRIHVVREPEMNAESQEFLEELLGDSDDEHYAVHFARPDDPMLGGRLVSALRRGEVVALQGDRPRVGGRVVRTSIFGRPYDLPLGPFALARAARVPLLPVFVFRAGRRRSSLHLREPITVGRTADRDADLAMAAGRFGDEIEWAIRRHPDQWFCLRELWPRI